MTSVIEKKTGAPGRFLRLPEVTARTGLSRSEGIRRAGSTPHLSKGGKTITRRVGREAEMLAATDSSP